MTQAYFHLISQLMSGVWAISPQAAEAAMPLVMRLLSGEVSSQTQTQAHETNTQIANVSAVSADYGVAKSASRKNGKDTKNIAIIGVQGTITKYSQLCGPAGTIEIGNAIQSADADPNIDGILLRIDSPGGMVDGTNTLAKIVHATKKPVLSFIDSGTMASAAYWIGSAAREVWAGENTDVSGSIGVMLSFVDVRGYYEKMGAKVHEVYASQSKDKNGDFAQALQGNYEPIQKNVLDKIATEFIGDVKLFRTGKIKEEALTGKVFMGSDAIDVGLVDKIGSFSAALQRVAQLAAEQANPTTAPSKASYLNSQNKEMQIFGKRWESLMAFLGFSFSASEDGKVQLSESHADKIEASLIAAESLGKENALLKAEIESLKKANADLTAANGTLQKEVAAKPAVEGTVLKKETDDSVAANTGEKKTLAQLMKIIHN